MMVAIPSESKPRACVTGASQLGQTRGEVSTKGGHA